MKKVSVTIVICNGLTLSDERWYPLLSQNRISRVGQLRQESDREMSIGAELAMLAALRKNSIEASAPVYYYDDLGKPQLFAADHHISLSHSGGLAVCALADIPLGTDIETPRRLRSHMARAILSPDESDCTQSEELLHKWTVKESYLKLTGEGVDRHSMPAITADSGVIYRGGELLAYYAAEHSLQPEFILSCCAGEPLSMDICIYTAPQLAMLLNV